MASLKDISGHVIFDLVLKEIDMIDGVSDRYKYAAFDIQVRHGASVLRPDGPPHISIQLIKILIARLQEITEGVLYQRIYDERWAQFSLEPLDQSFILDMEFQGFENENSSEEIVKIRLGFHSFDISQGQYPGYVITIEFSVGINDLDAFLHELKHEFQHISEAYEVWSYEI